MSGKTKEQIIDRFGNMNNELWRCRHQWVQLGDDPLNQDFNLKAEANV